MYVEKAAETTFVQKTRAYNVDEIDYWKPLNGTVIHDVSSHLFISEEHKTPFTIKGWRWQGWRWQGWRWQGWSGESIARHVTCRSCSALRTDILIF